jgi:hypothetical protein
MEIKRCYQHYYDIYAKPLCGVLVDEFLMRKINKVLSKYQNDINSILVNNRDHCIAESWALAYPNGKQTGFYSVNEKPQDLAVAKFITKKKENLFDIGDLSIFNEKVKEAVTKILEGEESHGN